MENRIDFPWTGCYVEKTDNTRFDEYGFHIVPEKCRSLVRVPGEVRGIPVTEVYVDFTPLPEHTDLKKLIIPRGIRRIEFDGWFFRNYPGLEVLEIEIEKGNPYFRVYDGALYRQRVLIHSLDRRKEHYDILPGTRRICSQAFLGYKVKSVTLPKSVRAICSGAFYDCTELRRIDLENVRTVGASAFWGCELSEIVFPKALRTVGALAFPKSVINRVILPKTITHTEDYSLSCGGRLRVYDEISYGILTGEERDFEISVISSVNGRLLYRIFYPKCGIFRKRFEAGIRKKGKFDFALYDSLFGEIRIDRDEEIFLWDNTAEEYFKRRLSVCVTRLTYPHMLSESAESVYVRYMREFSGEIIKLCIDEDDPERLQFCLEMRIVTADIFGELLEYCVQKGRTELTALLLDYKERILPDIKDDLTLE